MDLLGVAPFDGRAAKFRLPTRRGVNYRIRTPDVFRQSWSIITQDNLQSVAPMGISICRMFLTPLYVRVVLLLVAGVGFRFASADPIPAKYKQGSTYGFLLLKSADGKVIAVGDQVNVVHGNQMRSRLIFHFRDGSIDDETTVFRQGGVFDLVSDRHIQKGPSFPQPLDLAVNVEDQQVTWREVNDGKEKVTTEHMDLPADLANGMISLLPENFPPRAAEMKVSYLAGSSKPRLVKLSIKPAGKGTFRVGGATRRANRFNIHVEIGGVAGVIAPVIGKQPPDTQIWVMDSEVPMFLRMEAAFYENGPIWTTELAAPVWPKAAVGRQKLDRRDTFDALRT